MTQTYRIAGMTCSSCKNKVTTALQNLKGVTDVTISQQNNMATITMSNQLGIADFQQVLGSKYQILPLEGFESEIIDNQPKTHCELPSKSVFNWTDKGVWKRSAFNTLNCLIGCSIGDFGMLIFLQLYYPETPMMTQMALAIIAGLMTSVALETSILRFREKLNWTAAFKMAIGMSFLSMVGMEIAMNATDFIITGGQMALSDPGYWLAFIPAAMMGFLVPLPYNYYQLKKHNKACH